MRVRWFPNLSHDQRSQNPLFRSRREECRRIALLIEERCRQCNAYVDVCPTNVFHRIEAAPPVIARWDDFRTCFICALYCRAAALYVDPDCDTPRTIDMEEVIVSRLIDLPAEWSRQHQTLGLPEQ